MPLRYSKVKAKPVGLYLALLGVGVTTEPSDLTLTVDTAGAAADATAIPVEDPGADVPKNTVIEWSPASGDSFLTVVTADFTWASGSNEIQVESYEGAEGDGIPTALAAGDTGVWDRLYTVVGTENAPFANNPTTSELTAVTYGSGSGVKANEQEVTAVAPTITRSGLFIAEGQLTSDLLQYADTNRDWWVKQVLPDANGDPFRSREGRARVTDLQDDPPSDGQIRLSFTIRFQQLPKLTDLTV